MKLQHIFVVADEESSIGELCAGGRILGEKVTCVVFGKTELGQAAISYGADAALVCSNTDGMIEDYARTIADQAREQSASLVLLTASVQGRLMAGEIAAYLDTSVAASVSAVEADHGISTVRMVYGGAAVRTEKLTAAIPVVTLGAGVFQSGPAASDREGTVTELPAPQRRIKLLERQEKKDAVVNLATARCIVDMGRGFAAEEDLELGRNLAGLLGADVGCSRPVAESNGWMPRARYIGVTGVIVKPELCIVIGISGQVQHLVGINQSKTVVAINKDKNAPIFKHADFGVVGDMYKILPALISRLS